MNQAPMQDNLWGSDEEEVAAAPLPRKPRAPKVEPQPIMPPAKEKTVRIRLEENEGIPPTGQFFSLNGRTWLLRAGEEADVPEAIINILNDAIMSVPTVDPATMQVVGYRNKQRFPYSVIMRS